MLLECFDYGWIVVGKYEPHTQTAFGQICQLFRCWYLYPQPDVGHGQNDLGIIQYGTIGILFIGKSGGIAGSPFYQNPKAPVNKLVGANRIKRYAALPIGSFLEHYYG